MKNKGLVTFNLLNSNKNIGILTIKNSAKRNAISSEVISGLNSSLLSIEFYFQTFGYPKTVILESEGKNIKK